VPERPELLLARPVKAPAALPPFAPCGVRTQNRAMAFQDVAAAIHRAQSVLARRPQAGLHQGLPSDLRIEVED
jgi:hypothetical protein